MFLLAPVEEIRVVSATSTLPHRPVEDGTMGQEAHPLCPEEEVAPSVFGFRDSSRPVATHSVYLSIWFVSG